MSPSKRNLAAAIITWPGWIVVGVAVGGAVKATELTGEVRELQTKVREVPDIGRQLDSLRIEQRHMGETLEEIRHILVRPETLAPRRPIP